MPIRITCICSAILATLCHSHCRAFTFSWRRKSLSCSRLFYASIKADPIAGNSDDSLQLRPHWVPMELVELVADDLRMTQEDFVRTYADVEAYTSCDDEGDDFHECDFFQHYLGPTKWLHLTQEARESIDEMHFSIWKDVWRHPHGAVDVAEKVSQECLRYHKEFILEARTSVRCPADRPVIRVKVIPASFGLDGFEDAAWEATEDLIKQSTKSMDRNSKPNAEAGHHGKECCKAITFVVAAPDLFTDPLLMEDGGGKASPQAEFEPNRFKEFASRLREKLVMYSKMEGVPLDDTIQLSPFHPLWEIDEGAELVVKKVSGQFPYPCIAVSTDVDIE